MEFWGLGTTVRIHVDTSLWSVVVDALVIWTQKFQISKGIFGLKTTVHMGEVPTVHTSETY